MNRIESPKREERKEKGRKGERGIVGHVRVGRDNFQQEIVKEITEWKWKPPLDSLPLEPDPISLDKEGNDQKRSLDVKK